MGAEIIQLFKGPADLNGESMSIKVQDHVKVAVEPGVQTGRDRQLEGASMIGTGRDVRVVKGPMEGAVNSGRNVLAAQGGNIAEILMLDDRVTQTFAPGTSIPHMAA